MREKERNNKNKKEPEEKRVLILASAVLILTLIVMATVACYYYHFTPAVTSAPAAPVSVSSAATATAISTVAPEATPALLTATSTPTPAPTSMPTPKVISGGFVVNDSMSPPPEGPVSEPTGDPVILSLEGPETALVGDTFTVEVKVNPNGRNVTGIQTCLLFDKDLVHVDSVVIIGDKDEDFSVPAIPAIINNEQGAVENILGMSSPPDSFPAEEFIFAVITLTAKEPGDAKLQLERNVATYASGTDILVLLPIKAEEKTITIKTG